MIELIRKYTNEHSRFLAVKGTLIHYRIEGNGPDILLMHGSFSSLHTFDAWTKNLSKYFRVIRLDLPAFGLTGPMAQNCYTMEAYMEHLQEFLRIIGVKKCILVGSSLGGWIAWEYALLHKRQITKLVLIDAAGFTEKYTLPLPFRMAKTPFVGRVIKFAVRKAVLEEFLRDVYFNTSKITPTLVDRYYDLFSREGNPEAFLRLVNNKFKDHTRLLKKLKTPTLILWGKEDEWIPVEHAHKFHEALPHNDLIIYDLVGHLPMEEIPEDSVLDVLSFLKE